MLLKRLAPSLPPEAAALVPLLGGCLTWPLSPLGSLHPTVQLTPEPHVRATESVILTPRATLHSTVVTALGEEGAGAESSFAAARRDARVNAALDMLLQHCLERVPLYSGVDISPQNAWHGFGVLADVLPRTGGVMEIAGGKGVGKSVSLGSGTGCLAGHLLTVALRFERHDPYTDG